MSKRCNFKPVINTFKGVAMRQGHDIHVLENNMHPFGKQEEKMLGKFLYQMGFSLKR